MAVCPLCGKKMGILENQISEFEGDPGVCLSCHDVLEHQISASIKQALHAGKTEKEIKQEIINKYAKSSSSQIYLNNYVKNVWNDIFVSRIRLDYIDTMKELIKTVKITTGYDFDGYKISDYRGIISGESVIGTGLFSEMLAACSDLMGMNSDSFSQKMRAVKTNALEQLRLQAIEIGANAIIGIDFDYITFGNNMIGVSANGTAVQIEKSN